MVGVAGKVVTKMRAREAGGHRRKRELNGHSCYNFDGRW